MFRSVKERIEKSNQAEQLSSAPREIELARRDDDKLDILSKLPGKWANSTELEGRGWNMIALPFVPKYPVPGFDGRYRLLLNQYNETLTFFIADKGVKNRGLSIFGSHAENFDQTLIALDYEQFIKQMHVDDFPASDPDIKGPNCSGLTAPKDACRAIHHEPGLWLYKVNGSQTWDSLARQASIPHGNSVLAMGAGATFAGQPTIPFVSGLPSGASEEMKKNGYLMPYKHYGANPFKGSVTAPGFPGFDPNEPHRLLELALSEFGEKVIETLELHVSTDVGGGGILNIPFAVSQANPTRMDSTFWVMELNEPSNHVDGNRFIMQYLQVVNLEFFPRRDGHPGLAVWPHVSINTMELVEKPKDSDMVSVERALFYKPHAD